MCGFNKNRRNTNVQAGSFHEYLKQMNSSTAWSSFLPHPLAMAPIQQSDCQAFFYLGTTRIDSGEPIQNPRCNLSCQFVFLANYVLSSFDLLLLIWWPKTLWLNGVLNETGRFSSSLLFFGERQRDIPSQNSILETLRTVLQLQHLWKRYLWGDRSTKITWMCRGSPQNRVLTL